MFPTNNLTGCYRNRLRGEKIFEAGGIMAKFDSLKDKSCSLIQEGFHTQTLQLGVHTFNPLSYRGGGGFFAPPQNFFLGEVFIFFRKNGSKRHEN